METIDASGRGTSGRCWEAGLDPCASQNDQLMSEHRILPSSPLFDLNGEASTARTKQMSAIIAPT
jgi:hypothetical protein